MIYGIIFLRLFIFPYDLSAFQKFSHLAKKNYIGKDYIKVFIDPICDSTYKFTSKIPSALHFYSRAEQSKFHPFMLELRYFRTEYTQHYYSDDSSTAFLIDVVDDFNDSTITRSKRDFMTDERTNLATLLSFIDAQWSAINKGTLYREIKLRGIFTAIKRKQFFSVEYFFNELNSVIIKHIFPTQFGTCLVSELRLLLPFSNSKVYLWCKYIKLKPSMNDLEVMRIFKDQFRIERLIESKRCLEYSSIYF